MHADLVHVKVCNKHLVIKDKLSLGDATQHVQAKYGNMEKEEQEYWSKFL